LLSGLSAGDDISLENIFIEVGRLTQTLYHGAMSGLRLGSIFSAANSAPTAPTTPYSNDTAAQSGQTNPTGIIDSTPAFSAIYNDPDSGDIANKYRVEVNTQSDFAGTVMWDSGAGGTSMANTTDGNRCPDIIYAGSALADSTQYFWRITFWDDDNTEGTVSATQNFTTGTLLTKTVYYSIGTGGDKKTGSPTITITSGQRRGGGQDYHQRRHPECSLHLGG
jgi:hypothetical protein